MILLFALPVVACDLAVLDALAAPDLDLSGPVVATGVARRSGVGLVGAKVVMRSKWEMEAWVRVLARPEDEEAWLPAEFGTARVERLDPNHLFQQKEVRMLLGAVHVRRQLVTRIDWLERSATRLRNCWAAADPAPFEAAIRVWAWEGVEMLRSGLGGWDLHPLPDGGTYVSYQAWTDANFVPAAVQSRAMAGMLPDLMSAFEQRVGELSGR